MRGHNQCSHLREFLTKVHEVRTSHTLHISFFRFLFLHSNKINFSEVVLTVSTLHIFKIFLFKYKFKSSKWNYVFIYNILNFATSLKKKQTISKQILKIIWIPKWKRKCEQSTVWKCRETKVEPRIFAWKIFRQNTHSNFLSTA